MRERYRAAVQMAVLETTGMPISLRLLSLTKPSPVAASFYIFTYIPLCTAQIVPDFHAVTSANNLCAALLDNHIQQGNHLVCPSVPPNNHP